MIWQDAERRQAESRAKQQQRQREVEAAQQEAQERRQLLAEQKLSKLAGAPAAAFSASLEHIHAQHKELLACISQKTQHGLPQRSWL